MRKEAAAVALVVAAMVVCASCTPLSAVAKGGAADFSVYHRTDELLERVRRAAEALPGLAEMGTLREEGAGGDAPFDVPVVKLRDEGVRPGGMIKIKALVVAGEHGRELITGEVVLGLLEALARSWADRSSPLAVYVAALMEHAELTLVPVLNPWGRRRAEREDRCWRGNANGVDLNRNWDHLWSADPEGVGRPRKKGHEEYPGPAPFSEWETRALRDLVAEAAPDVYASLHSGAREMYLGWDDRAELVPNADSEVLPLLAHLNATFARCPYGGGAAIGGYPVRGSSMDYIYEEMGVRYSLTLEVHGGDGPSDDCFPFFNPVTRHDYDGVVRDWALAILAAPAFVVDLDGSTGLGPPTVDMWPGVGIAGGGGAGGPAADSAAAGDTPLLAQPADAAPYVLFPAFGLVIGYIVWRRESVFRRRRARNAGKAPVAMV